MSDLCPVAAIQDSNEIEHHPETFIEANLLLLTQKIYCDVTFTFPNLPDRIEAHEYCLKARSAVFAKIFSMRKSGNVLGNEIEITESTPRRFQEFLEFIYTDKFEVNIAGALDLLHLAHKYNIQPLTRKCEQRLKTEIKVEDSVQVFETARRYGRDDLIDRAGAIMAKSLAHLIQYGALANAEEETVMFLLQRDDLTVKEAELFEFILKWGKEKVTPSDGDRLLQDKLEKVLPLIRYTNMAPYEFNMVVVPTGLLSAEETISVFSYFAGDEVTKKNMKIKFNMTGRRAERTEDLVDFYAGIDDYRLRSQCTSSAPFKQCISFKAELKQTGKTVWSDYLLKKAAITGIKIKWPSLNIQNSTKADGDLNFRVCIDECYGPVNDENVAQRFQKCFDDCKPGSEREISIEPPVQLVSGVTYCVIVEDQSDHYNYQVDPVPVVLGDPYHSGVLSPALIVDSEDDLVECSYEPDYNYGVKYTYSGLFSPYFLQPEASVGLEGVQVKLRGIQKDNRLSGFANSTASLEINAIRSIKIGLV